MLTVGQITVGEMTLIAGVLLALGVLGSMIATRVQLPGLVLFLAIGMIVGDGSGLISFNDFDLAHEVGVIALALIMFEGGLAAGFPEIRPVLRPALIMATLGTFLTAGLIAVTAILIFDFDTKLAVLLGATVAGTDGAAIFALLRGSTLRRRLARTLEGETGMNDPVAIMLVIACIEWISDPQFGLLQAGELFVKQAVIGAAVAVIVSWGAIRLLRSDRLSTGGLYPVVTVATVAIVFGGADWLGGSGFLAAYLSGLMLGSAPLPSRNSIGSFHEGLGWIAQLTVFLALGLLVVPSELGEVWLEGTVIALALALIARPLAILIATCGQHFSLPERFVLGWAGLRGAVPIVLATFPVLADVPGSHRIFTIVFFVVLVSTVLQGSTFEWFADRVGVTTDEPALPAPLADKVAIKRLGAELLVFPVEATDAIVGVAVRDLGLPRDAVVNVIVRDDQAIPPRGSTRVMPGDQLHVLYREEAASTIMGLSNRWRSGPAGPVRRPRRRLRGASTIFSVRPWTEADGDATRPESIGGKAVIELLRLRRDRPGSLVVLEDGRYAICGVIVAVGARRQVMRWAQTRQTKADADERAWLRTVMGAVATDVVERSRAAND